MAEITQPSVLALRLRQLRHDWSVTQRQLSDALGLSGALVSSWENGTAVPPEERLNGYARFFATRRSIAQRPPALIPADDLTAEEELCRSELIDELVRLREEALDEPALGRTRTTGALGGRFWYFPDGQPITILCTPLTQRQLGYTEQAAEAGDLPPVIQYATNPSHPNAVRNLGNGDIDALLELVGHIRAENPTADLRWLTYDRITTADQLTGHVIVLGGGDAEIGLTSIGDPSVVTNYYRTLDLPVRARWPESEGEFGGFFEVSTDAEGHPTADPKLIRSHEAYRPRFVREEAVADRPRQLVRGAPQLTADVALVVRTRNPLNPSALFTLCSGVYSRGTYGAVRMFTDSTFRARNEQWLTASSIDAEDFWMLLRVSIFSDNTITPDISRASARLRSSS